MWEINFVRADCIVVTSFLSGNRLQDERQKMIYQQKPGFSTKPGFFPDLAPAAARPVPKFRVAGLGCISADETES